MDPAANPYPARIAAARKEGYSDDEILQALGGSAEMGPRIKAAMDAGYSAGEIIDHLNGAPPPAAPKVHNTSEYDKHGNLKLKGSRTQEQLGAAEPVYPGMAAAGDNPNSLDAKLYGLSDEARLIGTAMSPSILPALAANPVGTLTGLGVGSGVQQGMDKLGDYTTIPGTFHALGDALGLATGAVAGAKVRNPFYLKTPGVPVKGLRQTPFKNLAAWSHTLNKYNTEIAGPRTAEGVFRLGVQSPIAPEPGATVMRNGVEMRLPSSLPPLPAEAPPLEGFASGMAAGGRRAPGSLFNPVPRPTMLPRPMGPPEAPAPPEARMRVGGFGSSAIGRTEPGPATTTYNPEELVGMPDPASTVRQGNLPREQAKPFRFDELPLEVQFNQAKAYLQSSGYENPGDMDIANMADSLRRNSMQGKPMPDLPSSLPGGENLPQNRNLPSPSLNVGGFGSSALGRTGPGEPITTLRPWELYGQDPTAAPAPANATPIPTVRTGGFGSSLVPSTPNNPRTTLNPSELYGQEPTLPPPPPAVEDLPKGPVVNNPEEELYPGQFELEKQPPTTPDYGIESRSLAQVLADQEAAKNAGKGKAKGKGKEDTGTTGMPEGTVVVTGADGKPVLITPTMAEAQIAARMKTSSKGPIITPPPAAPPTAEPNLPPPPPAEPTVQDPGALPLHEMADVSGTRGKKVSVEHLEKSAKDDQTDPETLGRQWLHDAWKKYMQAKTGLKDPYSVANGRNSKQHHKDVSNWILAHRPSLTGMKDPAYTRDQMMDDYHQILNMVQGVTREQQPNLPPPPEW
jgi:hypothetical protein